MPGAVTSPQATTPHDVPSDRAGEDAPARDASLTAESVVDDARWLAATDGALDADVRTWLDALSAELEIGRGDFTLLFTNDARITELNAQFRNIERATNVLSFPSGDDDYIGDVALSFDTVQREAVGAGRPFQDHMAHLVMHGALHLLGHDQDDEESAVIMERIETSALARVGIPDPYGAAATSDGKSES
ncbi:MAG: rRNA maturation RNase YbeY [Pseudomonadota bacterium]